MLTLMVSCSNDRVRISRISILSLPLFLVLLRLVPAEDSPRDLELLFEAAKKNPSSAEAHHALGTALGEKGRLVEATQELEVAIKLKPDYAEALYNLGLTYVSRAKALRTADSDAFSAFQNKAFLVFQKALVLKPSLPNIHTHLGLVCRELGSQQAALEHFRSAIELSPQSAEAFNNLGTTLANSENFKEAIPAFRRATELDPTLTTAHLNLGNAVQHLGNNPGVVEEWRLLVAERPDSAVARVHLGHALQFSDRFDEAAKELQRAVTLAPDLAIAHYYLGQVLRELGDVPGSSYHLGLAVHLNPGNSEFLAEAALVDLQQNNLKVAIDRLRKSIKLNARNARAHYSLAKALQKAGNTTEAAEYFQKAETLNRTKLNLETATLHVQNGIKHLENKKLDQAIQFFQDALSAKPNFPEAYFYLAIALAQNGQGVQAIHAFQVALKQRPYNGEIHYNYGIALRQMGKTEEAIHAFRQAVHWNPRDGLAHCALGKTLQQQGESAEGNHEIKKARELGSCLPPS